MMHSSEQLTNDALYKWTLWQALWSGREVYLQLQQELSECIVNSNKHTTEENNHLTSSYNDKHNYKAQDNSIICRYEHLSSQMKHGIQLVKEALPRKNVFAPCCLNGQCSRGTIFSGFVLHHRLRAGRSLVQIDDNTGIRDEECNCLAHSLASLDCELEGLLLDMNNYQCASSVLAIYTHSSRDADSSEFASRGLRCLLSHVHWREICIQNIKLTADRHAILMELYYYFNRCARANLPCCHSLRLANITVTSAFVKLILAIQVCDVLKRLELCNIGVNSLTEVIDYLQQSKKLTTLMLAELDQCCEWSELASAVAANSSIVELRIRQCGWNNVTIYKFVHALNNFCDRPFFRLEIVGEEEKFDLNTLRIITCASLNTFATKLTGFVLGPFAFCEESELVLWDETVNTLDSENSESCKGMVISEHNNNNSDNNYDSNNSKAKITSDTHSLLAFCKRFSFLEELMLFSYNNDGYNNNNNNNINNNNRNNEIKKVNTNRERTSVACAMRCTVNEKRKHQKDIQELEQREQAVLLRALCSNPDRSWKQISFPGFNLSGTLLKRISHLSFHDRAALCLSGNNLHEYIAKMNLSLFLSKLRVLDLSCCSLHDDDITCLGHALEKSICFLLEVLYLEGNRFGSADYYNSKNVYPFSNVGNNDNEWAIRNSIINSVSRNYNKNSMYTLENNNNNINTSINYPQETRSSKSRKENKNSNFLFLSRSFRESCLPSLTHLNLAWNNLPVQPMLSLVDQVSSSLQHLDISYSSIANESDSVLLMLTAIKQRQKNNANVNSNNDNASRQMQDTRNKNLHKGNMERSFVYLDFYCHSLDDSQVVYVPQELKNWLINQSAVSVFARLQSEKVLIVL